MNNVRVFVDAVCGHGCKLIFGAHCQTYRSLLPISCKKMSNHCSHPNWPSKLCLQL